LNQWKPTFLHSERNGSVQQKSSRKTRFREDLAKFRAEQNYGVGDALTLTLTSALLSTSAARRGAPFTAGVSCLLIAVVLLSLFSAGGFTVAVFMRRRSLAYGDVDGEGDVSGEADVSGAADVAGDVAGSAAGAVVASGVGAAVSVFCSHAARSAAPARMHMILFIM
jgi:hypothetical protein